MFLRCEPCSVQSDTDIIMYSVWFQHFKGLLCCLGAGSGTVLFAILVKIGKKLDMLQVILISRLVTFAALLPIVVYKRHSVLGPTGDKLLMCACGITHGLSAYLENLCYRYLPLAIAMTLTASHQAIVVILGRIILKETLDWFKVSGVLLSITGIIVTCKLHEIVINGSKDIFSSKDRIIGFAAGAAGAVLTAVFLILLRKAKANSPIATTFSSTVSASMIISILFSTLGSFELMPCNWQQVLLPALALTSMFTVGLRILSVHLEDVAVTTIVITSWQLILSLVMQILIFHNYPDIFVIFGSILLMFSIIIISIGKWRKSNSFSL